MFGTLRAKGERGTTLVEFAMALPVFMLLVFGLIEFSRLMSAHTAVETAARESARYGSAIGLSPGGLPRYIDCDAIRQAGMQAAVAVHLESRDLQISYDRGPGTDSTGGCPVGATGPSPELIEGGDRIAVTVTADFNSVIPLIGQFIGDHIVTATDVRTIVKE